MKHIKAHNVGFMTESWDVTKKINEEVEETDLPLKYKKVPMEFYWDRRNSIKDVYISVEGNKIRLSYMPYIPGGKSGPSRTLEFTNDKEGWHNGVKKFLQLPLNVDTRFERWKNSDRENTPKKPDAQHELY